MQSKRTSLEQIALGASAGEFVAVMHMQGAFDTATESLDRLDIGLSLEQHAILMAHLDDALDCVAFCAMKLAAKILISEQLGEVDTNDVLASTIPTLVAFATRVSGEYVLEDDQHSVSADALRAWFDLEGVRSSGTTEEGAS